MQDKRLTQKASLERYRRSTAEVLALLHRLLPGATIEVGWVELRGCCIMHWWWWCTRWWSAGGAEWVGGGWVAGT